MTGFKHPTLPYKHQHWAKDPFCKAPGCGLEIERSPDACLVAGQVWHKSCADRLHYKTEGTAKLVERSRRRKQVRLLVMEGAASQTLVSRKRARRWADGDHICYLCGREIMHIMDADIDHVVPRSRGGRGRKNNKRLVHRTCNKRKGNKLPHELEGQ